jgi:hypothetical protein
MPFGYIGQNQPNQKVKNAGVLSSFDISLLEKNNHASGSYELIQSQTVNDTYVNFTSIKESEYDVHYITWHQIKDFSTSGANFSLRLFENGTLETASVYNNGHVEQKTSNQNYNPKGTYSSMFLSQGSLTSGESTSGYAYIYYAGNSNEYTYLTDHAITEDPAGTAAFSYGGSVLPQTSTVDGFNFSTINGSAQMTGVISLYGVKQ